MNQVWCLRLAIYSTSVLLSSSFLHLNFTPKHKDGVLYADRIFAVLSCTNIPTVDSILEKLESYEGVKQIEPYITTKLIYYQDWLQREIGKRLNSEEGGGQQQQLAVRKKDSSSNKVLLHNKT